MSKFLVGRYAAITPYTPGEQPKQSESFVKLNTNENPYPPSPLVQKAAGEAAARLQLYCDPTCAEVVRPLAASLGVSPAQVMVGNGSDELLAFCFMAFAESGAVFADITYGFYSVYAEAVGAKVKIIPLREDFTLCPEDYYAMGSTVFIANPNAPTGLALSRAEIEAILRHNPQTLVVIDEAYVDFGAETAVPLIDKYDNLLVVGTFSKSRSLAGGRLGYAVGSEALIQDLQRVKFSFNPYNVNAMTLAVGAASLKDDAYYRECLAKICATRSCILPPLRTLGFEAAESKANFVFIRHKEKNGEALYTALRQKGILVRWFNQPRIQNYLRVTIGTDGEMQTLLAALEEILA